MGDLRLSLDLASADDFGAVIGLIDAAAQWLRTQDTDQWAKPWPDQEARDERILADLVAGKTWLARIETELVATITADSADDGVWPEEFCAHPAVYVSRLVVARRHAGQAIGASLIDWIALRARSEHGARWVRVDVWTTNHRLHAYYRRQGFLYCGLCDTIPDYPSAALFQKSTALIREDAGLRRFQQLR